MSFFSFKNDFHDRESRLQQQIFIKEKENDDLKNKINEFEQLIEELNEKFNDAQVEQNVIVTIIKFKLKN